MISAIFLFLYKPTVFFDNIQYRIKQIIKLPNDYNYQFDKIQGNFIDGFSITNLTIYKMDEEISLLNKIEFKLQLLPLFVKNIELSYIDISNGSMNIDNLLDNNKKSVLTNQQKNDNFGYNLKIDKIHISDISFQLKNQSFSIKELVSDLDYTNMLQFNIHSATIVDNVKIEEYFLNNVNVNFQNNILNITNCMIETSVGKAVLYGEINATNIFDSNLTIEVPSYSYKSNEIQDILFEKHLIRIIGDTKSSSYAISTIGNLFYSNFKFDNVKVDALYKDNEISINNNMFSIGKGNIVYSGDFDSENWEIDLQLNDIKGRVDTLDYILNGPIHLSGVNSKQIFARTSNFIIDIASYAPMTISGGICKNNEIINSNENIYISSDGITCEIRILYYKALDDYEVGANIYFNEFNSPIKIKNLTDYELDGEIKFKLKKTDNFISTNGSVVLDRILVSPKIQVFDLLSDFTISLNNNQLNNLDFILRADSLQIGTNSFNNSQIIAEGNANRLNLKKVIISGENDQRVEFDGFAKDNFSYFGINSIHGNLSDIGFSADSIVVVKTNDYFSLSKVLLKVNDTEVYISGDYKNDLKYKFDLISDNLDLSQINSSLGIGQRIDGSAKGYLNISRWGEYPVILSNIEICNGKLDDILFDKLSGQFSYRDHRLTFNDFIINTKQGNLQVNGWATIPKSVETALDDSLHISAEYDNFELSSFNRYLPWHFNISGLVSGNLKLSEKTMDPYITMIFSVENPVFDRIIGKNTMGSLIYKDKNLYLKGIRFITENGKYTASGFIPVDLSLLKENRQSVLDNEIDIIITGSSLGDDFLIPYVNNIHSLSGRYSYQLLLNGTLRNPIRNGQVIVRNGQLNLLQLSNSIDDVNAVAKIHDNDLRIESLTATMRGKSEKNDLWTRFLSFINYSKTTVDSELEPNIQIDGYIDLSQFFKPKYNLNLSGNDIFISNTYGDFEGIGDAKFEINGRDTVSITGSFIPIADEFVISTEFETKSNLVIEDLIRKTIFNYDIYVPLNNSVKFENSVINIYADGELNITAQNNAPFKYSGTLNVNEGTFFFNGNEYTQTEGTIILDPSDQIPILDVHALTNIGGEDIYLSMIGKMNEPNLILESDSNYSQNDILELLLFRSNSTLSNTAISDQAGNFISNFLENELEKNVRQYKLIDRFQIQSSNALLQGFEDNDLNLFIGTNITPKTYLNIKSGISTDENNFEYEIGYRLNKNMSIVGRVDNDNHIHINYKLKFKY
jgi:hypothetical protein